MSQAESTAPVAPGSGRRFPTASRPSNAGIVAAAVTVGVLVLLLLVADTLPVFIIGLIVAYLLDPVATALAKRGVPRGLAALLAMGGLTLVLLALTAIFLDTVVAQATAFLKHLPETFDGIKAWIAGSSLSESVRQDLLAWLDALYQTVIGFDVSSLVAPVLQGLFTVLGSFFTLLVLPFFVFYVIAGRPAIQQSVQDVLPEPWREDVDTVIWIVLDSFGTYVRAEAIVAVILGVLTWASLTLLSFIAFPEFGEFALLLGIIAAFSELVPNFGPWIAAIPAVLFALTVSPAAVGVTIALYIVLMFIEGQVLVPKIEGGAFSFHPALVLFLVVAGIALMGILGAILALPVTAMAWRTARYAFRRAGGMPAGRATATLSDEDAAALEAVVEPPTESAEAARA